MKISKLFHFLYASVMTLPLLAIPIFAVYSNNQNSTFDMSVALEESKVVNFNQLVDTQHIINSYSNANGLSFTNLNNGSVYITGTATTSGTIYFYDTNISSLAAHRVVYTGSVNAGGSVIESQDFNGVRYTLRLTTGTSARPVFTYTSGTTYDNSYYPMAFDLTLMFGAGNEPSLADFISYFPYSYYAYNTGEQYLIDNYASTTYNDTDIVSQYVYSIYNVIDKYFNFDNVFNFGDLYSWLQETFFSGTAPLGFFIFWHYLTYWLLISLIWLIFDVLMYVPNLVHSWLDKGGIE